MAKLDLSAFITAVADLPSAERLSDDLIGESYLVKWVLIPLINGETVSIDDLDFNKFDQTCIHTLIERCEEADQNCSALPLYQQALNTRPAVQSDCDFV